MGANTTLAWVAGFTGAGLVFAALRGQGPIASITAALQGTTAPGVTGSLSGNALAQLGAVSPAQGAGADAADTAVADGTLQHPSASGGPVAVSATVLVKCGRTVAYPSGTVRLIPAAGAAFTAWQAAFGQLIAAAGWRSIATQTAGREADSKRFASAQSSFHTAGKAVDVDLGGMTAAVLSRLRTTAKANGWVQARAGGEAACGTNTANDDEPWHFSWGGCG